jgi:hypothetical protein
VYKKIAFGSGDLNITAIAIAVYFQQIYRGHPVLKSQRLGTAK